MLLGRLTSKLLHKIIPLREAFPLSLLKKMIPKSLKTELVVSLYLELPDRKYMEETILPAFAGLNPERVLFVGTTQYTTHYEKYFKVSTCEYWTMDINPQMEIFGAKGRHIIGSVIDADHYFSPDFFDIVILNGVLGWGVDEIRDQDRTLEAIRKILKEGGILLLGWDTDRIIDPMELKGIRNHFSHCINAPLPDRVTLTESKHVYDFFTAH
jgi:SAM-dependent methyltransferase